uniref:INO80 complex subunit E N-terminal domain-containing protein n=1 Tax=Anopheles epiroticus TaxID=199890 RepID=A0A182PI21_9DIPT
MNEEAQKRNPLISMINQDPQTSNPSVSVVTGESMSPHQRNMTSTMMPESATAVDVSSGGEDDSDDEESLTLVADYKTMYAELKRKMKILIHENVYFQNNLRASQKRLLKITRDRSFLLDRLLEYERVEVSSSDSDETVESDDSTRVEVQPKRRKIEPSTSQITSTQMKPPAKPLPQQLSLPQPLTQQQQSQQQLLQTQQLAQSSQDVLDQLTPEDQLLLHMEQDKLMDLIKQIPQSQQLLQAAQQPQPSQQPPQQLMQTHRQHAYQFPLSMMSQVPTELLATTSNSDLDGTVDDVVIEGPQITKEELERHLQSRQIVPQVIPEGELPIEMFNNNPSSSSPSSDPNSQLKDAAGNLLVRTVVGVERRLLRMVLDHLH